MNATENMIEFIKGSEMMTVTLSSGRHMTVIRKLAKRFPDQVKIIHDRDNAGYFLAHLPVSFLTFRGSLQLTDEQREARTQTLRDYQKQRRASTKFGEINASNIKDDESIIEGQEGLFND